MSHRLKITIKNDTDYALLSADDAEETVLEPPAILATGGNPLPQSIEPHKDCDFTIATPIDGPSPEGSIVLQLDTLQVQVVLSWTDFMTATSDAEASAILNPCSWADERLDGAVGEVDVTIEYFDEKGQAIDFADLAATEAANAQRQKSSIAKALADPQHAPAVAMPTIEARFTLKVRVPQSIGTAPSRQPATMSAGAVRPTGSSKRVTGSPFPRWDTPGISMRRQKLLAAIGNGFPMVWDQKEGDVEPKSKIPYQNMGCWSPGEGTSCTNVATSIEKLLTGRSGKWGFGAFFFEDAWVPWGANPAKPMPNVGDIYLLYADLERDSGKKVKEKPQLRHAGFILRVPKDESEPWVTADGGQIGKEGKGHGGGGAYLNIKPWVKRLPTATPNLNRSVWDAQMKAHQFANPIANTTYPYLAGGAESDTLENANRLLGWLDIDALPTPFLSNDFDEPLPDELLSKPGLVCQQMNRYSRARRFTEADYRFLGDWIKAMLGESNDLQAWLAHMKAPAENPAPPSPTWWQPFSEHGGRYVPA